MSSLSNAELVLFVDDDDSQPRKLYVLLNDGLRSDDEVDLTGGDSFE